MARRRIQLRSATLIAAYISGGFLTRGLVDHYILQVEGQPIQDIVESSALA